MGYYAGGKTSEILSKTIPEKLVNVVERHKKIQLGASLAQCFIPGAGFVAMAAAAASLWKMYYDINGVLGIKISENAGKSIASAVLTNLGSYGAQVVATSVSEGAKAIPLVGWIASAGISTVTTTAIIYGAAYLYLNALTTMYEAEGSFNLESLESLLNISANQDGQADDENNYYNGTIYTITTLGHVDHGKTTLAAAISSVQSRKGFAERYLGIDSPETTTINGVTFDCSYVNYISEIRQYYLFDMPGHGDYVKVLGKRAFHLNGAIVVVSATDGPMPQTHEQVLMANQAKIPNLVVFLNKCDLVDDEEILELVEAEIQEILDQYGYDDTPIIRGSALGALNGDRRWIETVEELIEACDEW